MSESHEISDKSVAVGLADALSMILDAEEHDGISAVPIALALSDEEKDRMIGYLVTAAGLCLVKPFDMTPARFLRSMISLAQGRAYPVESDE